MMEKIKNFFNKWWLRFKIFVFLFSIWAVFFSVNTVLDNKVAFEYDDGFVYSGDVFRKVEKAGIKPLDENYWKEINSNCTFERKKLIPFFISNFLKFIGIKVDFIIDRKKEGEECILNKWKNFASNIYFVSNQDEKYSLLKANGYLVYFSSSDEGIVQAQKAKVYPVRIRRNKKSTSFFSYNPKKFGEKVIPLSDF